MYVLSLPFTFIGLVAIVYGFIKLAMTVANQSLPFDPAAIGQMAFGAVMLFAGAIAMARSERSVHTV